jgi:hypothetical protein
MTSILKSFKKGDEELAFTNLKSCSIIEDIRILSNEPNIFSLVFNEKNESAFKLNYK